MGIAFKFPIITNNPMGLTDCVLSSVNSVGDNTLNCNLLYSTSTSFMPIGADNVHNLFSSLIKGVTINTSNTVSKKIYTNSVVWLVAPKLNVNRELICKSIYSYDGKFIQS
jgi:hypothetical protein